MRLPRIRERGFVLIAMSVSMFLLLAVIGLAFDLGRVYIARNEAQVFTDAAAMTAAARLDGTPAGLTTAREDVAHLPIRWNLGTEDFRGVVIEFSADQSHWEKDPEDTAARFGSRGSSRPITTWRSRSCARWAARRA